MNYDSLTVEIFTNYILDTRTGLVRVQVVMTHDERPGVAPAQVFKQPAQRYFLLLRAGVGGLTSGVEPALVAHADGVAVVVLAVGAHHVFRTTGLNLSVTTDHVVVADAEVETPLAVPCVDLSGRRSLVGFHCRTVNHNQSDGSHHLMHDCAKKVVITRAIIDPMNFRIFPICVFFNLIIKLKFLN
jgi:hypothetical protein